MKVPERTITRYTLSLSAIVLIGASLRLYQLGTQSIWFDEAFSVWVAKAGVLQIIQTTAKDTHPPLYYFILHYWMAIFGDSELAVRGLSAFFGILAIPMVYVIGRQLFDEEGGLVAALILALSPFNVAFSQDARMYSLTVLLALVSMYFFLRLHQYQHSSLALSIGYIGSTTLMLYTHLYGWFVVAAQNVYVVTLLVLLHDHPFRTRRWILLQAIVILLFIPWIPFLAAQTATVLAHQPVVVGVTVLTDPAPTAESIIHTLTVYAGSTSLLVLFLGLAVLSVFTYEKSHGSLNWRAPLDVLDAHSWDVRVVNVAAVWFLALWASVVNILPYAISQFSVSIYSYRYAIAASVALYLLAAGGIRNLNNKFVKVVAVALVIVLLVGPLQAFYAIPTKPSANLDASGAFAFVNANAREGDSVIIFPIYHIVVADYYNKRADIDLKSFGSSQRSVGDNIKELLASLVGSERIWFVTTGSEDSQLNMEIVKTFNESYDNRSLTHFHGYDVYLFAKRS